MPSYTEEKQVWNIFIEKKIKLKIQNFFTAEKQAR